MAGARSVRWAYVAAVGLVACRAGNLVEVPPGATRLQFNVQPTSANPGTQIEPHVQVALLYESRWADTTFHDSIVLVLAQNPGGAVLSGTTVVAAHRGIATFTDLWLDQPGSGYVLRATTRSRPAAMSDPFGIGADSAPPQYPVGTWLEFTVQPGTMDTGGVITPAVLVVARTSAGTTLTTFTGPVMIAIGANPPGGVLSGTLSAVASQGVARFTNLSINRVGAGYTLAALTDGLDPAISAPFSVQVAASVLARP